MNIDPSYLPIVDLLGKGLATLLLAFGIQNVWRRFSAAERSLVWLAAFAMLAVLPVSLLVRPQWEWRVGLPAAPMAALPASAPAPLTMTDDVVLQAAASPASSWWQRLTPTGWVITIWGLGGALILGFRVIGGWQLHRLRMRSPSSTNKRVHHHLEWLAEELEVSRAIDVRESADTSVPLTWGWLKPVLLLPAGAAAWEDEKLDAALRHELGHMRHHDACTRWLGTIVCALWWPVPPVWMALKAWKLEQEKACDDLVLRAGAPAQDYAMQLLEAARSFSAGTSSAMAMARPSTLENRLRAVMDEQRSRRPMSPRSWTVCACAILAAGSLCVLAQLRAVEAATGGTTIQLVTEVIEAPKGTLTALSKAALNAEGSCQLSADEWAALKGALNKTKGVNLLSSPTVTTRPGVKATIHTGGDERAAKAPQIDLSIEPSLETTGLHLDFLMRLTLPGTPPQGSTVKMSITVPEGKVVLVTNRRTTSPDREVFCVVVPTIISDGAPPADPSRKPGPAETMATGLILKKVKFQGASLNEALDYLRMKSRDLDPQKKGLNIVLADNEPDSRITLELSDVPLNEALLYCAEVANRTVTYTANSAVLRKVASPPQASPASGKSGLVTRASQIIIPQVEFSGATVEEAIEYLRVKVHELTPDTGVNIVLQPGTSSETKITLSLKDVPYIEALTYTAELAGLKIEAGERAFVLSPKIPTGGAGAVPKASSAETAAVTAVTNLMSKDKLHLRSCEFKKGRLILVGEATSNERALALLDELRREPALAGFQWVFPAPEVKPYGFAVFRAEGTPPAK